MGWTTMSSLDRQKWGTSGWPCQSDGGSGPARAAPSSTAGPFVLRAAAWGLFLQGLDPRKPAQSILVRLDQKSTVIRVSRKSLGAGVPPYTTQPSKQSQDARRVVPTTMSAAADELTF